MGECGGEEQSIEENHEEQRRWVKLYNKLPLAVWNLSSRYLDTSV